MSTIDITKLAGCNLDAYNNTVKGWEQNVCSPNGGEGRGETKIFASDFHLFVLEQMSINLEL